MEYSETQNIVVMDLVDLEHCGFDYEDFESELVLHGIDKDHAMPIALIVNIAGGHILTSTTSEETLRQYNIANQQFRTIVEAIKAITMKMKFEMLSWDYKDSPPWNRINELIKEYPACHIAEVENTHDDSNAIIVSDGIISTKDVQTIYDTTYGYEA